MTALEKKAAATTPTQAATRVQEAVRPAGARQEAALAALRGRATPEIMTAAIPETRLP